MWRTKRPTQACSRREGACFRPTASTGTQGNEGSDENQSHLPSPPPSGQGNCSEKNQLPPPPPSCAVQMLGE